MHNSKNIIDVVTKEMYESHLNFDRSPIFQVTNLNRNSTQLMPSVIQYQPSPTAQNDTTRYVKDLSQL